MTKEDYMKLSKERLAELLAERDSMPAVPVVIGSPQLSCYEGGPCINPFHDCINCPQRGYSGEITTTTNIQK